MKKANIFLIISIAVSIVLLVTNIVSLVAYSRLKYEYYVKDYIYRHLVSECSEKSVNLKKVTPFEWDKAVYFIPYVTQKKMSEISGIHINLERLEYENLRRIIFIRNEKVIFDYVFDISDLEIDSENLVILDANSVFNAEFIEGAIVLTKK